MRRNQFLKEYATRETMSKWSGREDSNLRPPGPETEADVLTARSEFALSRLTSTYARQRSWWDSGLIAA